MGNLRNVAYIPASVNWLMTPALGILVVWFHYIATKDESKEWKPLKEEKDVQRKEK